MHKFFVEKSQIESNSIYISGNDLKHIQKVLRLRPGDKIEVSCDGSNYLCEISKLDKDKIETTIISKGIASREAPIEISLYQGLAKGSKMDFIIQKCVEIGVKDFYAIETERTIVKIKDEKKEINRIERWQSIAEEAAKQSKRDFIPHIKGILKFDEMVNVLSKEEATIVPYENEENLSIRDGLGKVNSKKINLIIGPEGGFEDYEIEKLRDLGAQIVTLGPRTLRTETAALVSSAIILYELGNVGVI